MSKDGDLEASDTHSEENLSEGDFVHVLKRVNVSNASSNIIKNEHRCWFELLHDSVHGMVDNLRRLTLCRKIIQHLRFVRCKVFFKKHSVHDATNLSTSHVEQNKFIEFIDYGSFDVPLS